MFEDMIKNKKEEKEETFKLGLCAVGKDGVKYINFFKSRLPSNIVSDLRGMFPLDLEDELKSILVHELCKQIKDNDGEFIKDIIKEVKKRK